MKVLFIDTGVDDTGDYFRREREKYPGCNSVCLYKNGKKTLFDKLIQAIGVYLFTPILYLIYGDWKYKLDEYDAFIIVSRRSAKYAIKYIKKKTQRRVIVWYWNLVTYREIDPYYCKKIGCEPWSFDKADCDKYGMKFGDTYYFPPEKNDRIKTKFNVFFVGINRPGREDFLNKLKIYLQSHNLTWKFHLTAIPTDPISVQKKYDKRLSYSEIIRYIILSDCILDLNRKNQSGMTLRPMEALFFGKKLITNNSDIRKYKAYVKENTFIIQNNDFSGICDFLNRPTREIDQTLLKFYSFSSWMYRVLNEIEAE